MDWAAFGVMTLPSIGIPLLLWYSSKRKYDSPKSKKNWAHRRGRMRGWRGLVGSGGTDLKASMFFFFISNLPILGLKPSDSTFREHQVFDFMIGMLCMSLQQHTEQTCFTSSQGGKWFTFPNCYCGDIPETDQNPESWNQKLSGHWVGLHLCNSHFNATLTLVYFLNSGYFLYRIFCVKWNLKRELKLLFLEENVFELYISWTKRLAVSW